MFFPMPFEMLRVRPDASIVMKIQRLLVKLRQLPPIWRGFGESSDCDLNQNVISIWNRSPEPGIEHPVGVGREGKTIPEIVISAD